jgi:hypothetical protein
MPAEARRALFQVTPVTIASWALGGFYFSLMPSLVRVTTGVTFADCRRDRRRRTGHVNTRNSNAF